MKKTRITSIPFSDIPSEVASLAEGMPIYDSSSSPEARVYFIDREGGFYAKRAERGTLRNEGMMTDYFHSIGLAPRVEYYIESEYDWLVTRAADGEDLTSERYLSDPRRLAVMIGENLRSLHERSISGCPPRDRVTEYLSLAERNYRTGNYDKTHFPDSFGYASAEDAWARISKHGSTLCSEVLIHGDYCLPNIIAKDGKIREYIDLGAAGIGDRHIDIFWGVFTLEFNTGTDRYKDLFLDAYGRDRIDEEKLLTVAAAEVFG